MDRNLSLQAENAQLRAENERLRKKNARLRDGLIEVRSLVKQALEKMDEHYYTMGRGLETLTSGPPPRKSGFFASTRQIYGLESRGISNTRHPPCEGFESPGRPHQGAHVTTLRALS